MVFCFKKMKYFLFVYLVRLKCGVLEMYDKQYDRVTTKSERRLKRINRIFHKVTTTDDPVIRKVICPDF